MALRALMLKKEIDSKRKSLDELNTKISEFEKREFDLEKAIEEAQADEEKKAVEEAVDEFEKEKAEVLENKANLEQEINDLENELAKNEEEQNVEPPVANEPQEEKKEERGREIKMETRKFFNLSSQERDAFMARDDVKEYLGEIRSCIKEKRALNNIGLTIPQVFIGLIRENIMDYSKLVKHVWLRSVGGTARAVVMSNIPEAVWTECCANLNEMSLTFYEMELDCWKVGKETLNVINA